MQALFSTHRKTRSVLTHSVKAALLTLGGIASLASQTVHAQSDAWWFDVEVILFKRIVDGSQLNESFPYAIESVDLNRAVDLFSAKLSPKTDGFEKLLPRCYQQSNSDIHLPLQTAPGFSINESLFHPLPPDPAPTFEEAFEQLEDTAAAYNEFEQLAQSEQARQLSQQENNDQAGAEEPSLESLQMAFSLPPDDGGLVQSETSPIDIVDANSEQFEPKETTDTLAAIVSELNDDADALAATASELNDDADTLAATVSEPSNDADALAATAFELNDDADALAATAFELNDDADAMQQLPAATHEPLLFEPDATKANLVLWQVPDSLACHFQEEAQVHVPFPDEVPNPLLGLARNDVKDSYLLPRSELKLRKLARDLHRKRGIDGLTHFAWRQKVEFGKNKAKNYRIFAGKNYSKQFSYEGYPIAPNSQQNSLSQSSQNSAYIGDDFAPKPFFQIANEVDAKFNAETATQGAVANLAHSGSNPFANIQNGAQADSAMAQADIVSHIEQQLAALALAQEQGANSQTDSQSNTLPTLDVPLLPDANKPENVWELDGRFKLYLQNIGRVPYLHIDSHFNYRQPMMLDGMTLPEAYDFDMLSEDGTLQPQQFLKPYPFKQLRRVISKQIHYFDHPMFGMVVQIRRYRLPSFMR